MAGHDYDMPGCVGSEGEKGFLRILALADLHDCLEMLERLRCKVSCINPHLIVFCGDLHNASNRMAARPVALALAGLGLPVLAVPGNMDHRDAVPDLWQEAGLIMLNRACYHYGSAAFLGMGGMVARDLHRLSDPARFYHRDEDVYRELSALYPQAAGAKCRIIVVHQPPRGVQDTLYNGESSGSFSLRRFIEEVQPDLLLCGHIHEARGAGYIGRTKVVNVGELRKGFGAIVEIITCDEKRNNDNINNVNNINNISIEWINLGERA